MSKALTQSDNPVATAPRKLGRYTLRYRIAQGGMASVYLAQLTSDAGFAKWVAIKTIHSHIATDRQFMQMFLNEARLAARLEHPNLCTVFDFGDADGTYFLAMEYLHGDTLGTMARRAWQQGALPIELAARIVADAARGLHAAHELKREDGGPANVVHRDVSPQNIFVLYSGVTKVVDFGIARSADHRGERTATGILKGKLPYMSPEQIQDETVNRRTDLWALGVVLWEISVGRRLFKRPTDPTTLIAVLRDEIPAPSTFRAGYPRALEAIVMRLLDRDPVRRFASGLELARALEAFLAAAGIPTGADEVGDYMHTLFADQIVFRDGLLHPVHSISTMDIANEWSDASNDLAPATPSKSGERSSQVDVLGMTMGAPSSSPLPPRSPLPPIHPEHPEHGVVPSPRPHPPAGGSEPRPAPRKSDRPSTLRQNTPAPLLDLPPPPPDRGAYSLELPAAPAVMSEGHRLSERAPPRSVPPQRRGPWLIGTLGAAAIAGVVFIMAPWRTTPVIPVAPVAPVAPAPRTLPAPDPSAGMHAGALPPAPRPVPEAVHVAPAPVPAPAPAVPRPAVVPPAPGTAVAPVVAVGPHAPRTPPPRGRSHDATAAVGTAPPATTPTPATASENQQGFLNIASDRRAEVFNGSRSLGFTPIVNHAMPPGHYDLRLVPEEGEAQAQTVSVTIEPGASSLSSLHWH